MIGVKASMPNAPRLVTVKVPPCISSAVSLPLAGAVDQVARPGRELPQAQARHVADDRDEQAGVGVHGDADVDAVGEHDACRRPSGR